MTTFFFFFFNDTATTEIYTLSLHDALPIFSRVKRLHGEVGACCIHRDCLAVEGQCSIIQPGLHFGARDRKSTRLNSSHANISYAVFCLKKKKKHIKYYIKIYILLYHRT